ncbi:MAG TPA: glycosyltransferase family 4 protein [Gaiellaceae bacterium]|nr:glycosyltransferase family 4 protein [Gaiellaceae bacterium]
MRALHVHRIAGVGGSERHLLTLLPALRAHGVEPLFVGLDDPEGDLDPFYRSLDEAGIAYRRLACPRDVDPLLVPRLVRAARSLRPDLLHSHLVHADVYGAAAAEALRVPLYSTKHNDDPFRIGLFRHVERVLTLRAHRVVAITTALERFLVERVGLPERKVTVVHYGLDEPPRPWGPNPEVPLPRGARVLLAIGRLVEQKGLDVAIDALPEVRRSHDAHLVVLGEGPLRQALLERARVRGVADAVHLPGRAGDVAALLRRADVFVHPSRWEGFGLVLLEAMLAGVPIVATRVSAIPEIVVDGSTGMLVPPDDAVALAKAVDALLANASRAASSAEAGRERARSKFSVERMARRTAEIYGTT